MKRLFARDIFKLCLVVLLAGVGLSAQAQSNTALKIIVPFTPGTGMDTIARTVQPMLSEHMGQPVVCLLYTSPSPRDGLLSRMPSSA